MILSLISVNEVSKSFKGNALFENVNLDIEKGKIYGFVGPNGSGKSVLFKMICGFIFPDKGTISIQGSEIGKDKRFPENFGVIIDRPGFIANKTGFENLKELSLIQGVVDDKQIIETMKIVGLDPNYTQKAKNYSLGMKQKLAICQAIMENQEVLILDEPFNALDIDSVKRVRDLLIGFKEEGRTILLTSHNQEDIKICDVVYRINSSKLERI
ncbi:ATP-binding cassette domain-containing protein [Neobacillus sp. OS1-2]|uniref:ATP-binding cassette domain-containing protein n=1 Tax=Neobacillus sp. OS1-2 TaxID=3070680 RepID=UPI0035A68A81